MSRLYPRNTDRKPKCPIFDKDGQIIGYVEWTALSTSVSKHAGFPVEYSAGSRFGKPGWVPAIERKPR